MPGQDRNYIKWYIDLIFKSVRQPLATWLKYRLSWHVVNVSVCASVLMYRRSVYVFVCVCVRVCVHATASCPMSVHYSALYQPTNQTASLQGHHLGPSNQLLLPNRKECHLISITRKWAGSCWRGSFWCLESRRPLRGSIKTKCSPPCCQPINETFAQCNTVQ